MSIRNAPCEWELLGCDDCEALTGLPVSARAPIESAAVEFLWNRTGKRFGLCSVSLRPCRQDCGGSTYHGRSGTPPVMSTTDGGSGADVLPWVPVVVDGEWRNIYCGECGQSCSCTEVSEIILPGPVDSVTEVLLDGTILPASGYRVDNNRRLVRLGGARWPTCQDMTAPAVTGVAGDGAWQVTYNIGIPVPNGGKLAAGTLACELAKALCNDDSCRLPQRVQTITRAGVTTAFLDPFEGLEKGRTGIWMVDSWVSSITNSPAISRVMSPDAPLHRRVT